MAISRENGVDLIKVHDKSINKKKFLEFLDELRQKYFFADIMLMMDNIIFHKSADVRARMDELGFHYAYTVKYMPAYNGIEEVINIGKRLVKKERLDQIQNNKKTDLKQLITPKPQNPKY